MSPKNSSADSIYNPNSVMEAISFGDYDTYWTNTESYEPLKWNETEEGAISQIKDRKYPKILEGLKRDILLVGISYSGKDPNKKHTCKIEKLKTLS